MRVNAIETTELGTQSTLTTARNKMLLAEATTRAPADHGHP